MDSGVWFWCPKVVQQELIENRLNIKCHASMIGSGEWFSYPRVAKQELIEKLAVWVQVQNELLENHFPKGFPDGMLGSGC